MFGIWGEAAGEAQLGEGGAVAEAAGPDGNEWCLVGVVVAVVYCGLVWCCVA